MADGDCPAPHIDLLFIHTEHANAGQRLRGERFAQEQRCAQVHGELAVEAFRIILSDPSVKGILVNIFGGIAKCDLVAEALVQAGREVGFKVPAVVRLGGTNGEKAREILSKAKGELHTLLPATDLTDAAQKVVAAVKSAA